MADFSLFQQLVDSPSKVLTDFCPIALRTFLLGYKSTNIEIVPILEQLSASHDANQGADPFTLAYLSYSNLDDAFRVLIRNMNEIVEELPPLLPRPGADSALRLIDVVGSAIASGRPALILGNEATVLNLSNYANGRIAGLRRLDPAAAAAEQEEIADFDAWLRSLYGFERPWYHLIRVIDGACEWGLRRFSALWTQYEKARQTM